MNGAARSRIFAPNSLSDQIGQDIPMQDDTVITGPLYESKKKVYPQATHGTFRNIKWG